MEALIQSGSSYFACGSLFWKGENGDYGMGKRAGSDSRFVSTAKLLRDSSSSFFMKFD